MTPEMNGVSHLKIPDTAVEFKSDMLLSAELGIIPPDLRSEVKFIKGLYVKVGENNLS